MGTGISMAVLNAGLSVIMVERDEELIKKSFIKIESTYQRNVDLGRISLEEKNKVDRATKLYSKALGKLEQAYKTDRNNPDILNYLGFTLRKTCLLYTSPSPRDS